MTFDNRIREVALSGFQTFAELTRIPIRRLTFLFGPNSAGKSALEDAIEIFHELYGTSTNPVSEFHPWADDSWACKERLGRHWRRTGVDVGALAPEMQIGVTFWIGTNLEGALFSNLPEGIPREVHESESKQPQPISSEIHFEEVELLTRFRYETGTFTGGWHPAYEVFLKVNGIPVTELIHEKSFGINLEHPYLKGLLPRGPMQTILRDFSPHVEHRKGWLRFKSTLTGGIRGLQFALMRHEWARQIKVGEINEFLTLAENAAAIYGEIFAIILGNMFQTKLPLVRASRAIPSDLDLTFLLDPEAEFDDIYRLPQEQWGVKDTGSAEFRDLAQSCWTAFSLPHDEHNGPMAELEKLLTRTADLVNHALTDHLFLERGYRIGLDYRIILAPRDLGAPYGESLPDPCVGVHPTLVRLFLVDAEGRRFSFADVGSGLGYVLPVLCATCGEFEVVLVQQPELHLHPALQSALGDIFIETSTDGRQRIIETHSEHLLLRVLKRMRQTNAGTCPTPSLHIDADEVSVAYFLPSPEGTTSVKRLRLSPEGEFLDRWPRGFFSERDQELFDE